MTFKETIDIIAPRMGYEVTDISQFHVYVTKNKKTLKFFFPEWVQECMAWMMEQDWRYDFLNYRKQKWGHGDFIVPLAEWLSK